MPPAAPPLPACRTLYVGCIPAQRRWHVVPHLHEDHHEIIIVVAGGIDVQFPDQRLAGRAGEVLLYQRGIRHEEWAAPDAPLETLFVGWTSPRLKLTRWPVRVFDHLGRIESLGRWMLDLQPAKTRAQQQLLNSLLTALLHEYLRCAAAPVGDAIQRVRTHVREHLATPLTLENLATIAGMSKFHFARAFHAATGITPMRYVRQQRVEAARMLLARSHLPLRAVAPLVGFSDEFQLSRVFKRITGHSPRPTRRASG